MYTCDNCRTGTLKQIRTTYTNWHAGHFVVVPNMRAWQCDVCAGVEFDADAMQQLLTLLGPVSRPLSAHNRPGVQHDARWFDDFSATRKYQ